MLQSMQMGYYGTDYCAADYAAGRAAHINSRGKTAATGGNEASFQIGSNSFTEKEWNKLLEQFDDIQDAVRKLMREEHTKREEKRLEKERMSESAGVEAVNAYDELTAKSQKNINSVSCKLSVGQTVTLDRNALFSICHVPTGETLNVYKSEDFSDDNQVYIAKGFDANGKPYEYEINVNEINPQSCSYNEMVVWCVHNGRKDFAGLAAMRGKAGMMGTTGEVTNGQKLNYLAILEELLNDMRKVGTFEDCKRYESWIDALMKYV